MFILSFSLIFALGAQAADLNSDPRLDKHVTFRTVAAPAPEALAGLAKAAGLPIKAGGLMKREILLFRLQDAPLRDIMTRLARASNGSWEIEEGTYYLTRTSTDDNRTLMKEHNDFVAAMKGELAKVSKAASEQTPFTTDAANALAKKFKALSEPKQSEGAPPQMVRFAEGAKLTAATPAGRLAEKIISKLSAEMIASAPAFKRTVYSTSPTKMEVPLNLDVRDAVNVFATEANTWADAIGGLSQDEQMHYLLRFQGQQDHISTAPAKVNVIINRDFNGIIGASVDVKVYDADGKMLGNSDRQIRIEDDGKSMASLAPDPKEAKLAVSPDELALISVMSRAMGGRTTKSAGISPELRQRLMHPDKFEPLATASSTMMLEAGDAKNLNIVADLPDLFLLLGIASTRNGMPTATSFINLMQALPQGTCPARLENGWLEIDGGTGPDDNMFIHRDDREALATLFNSGDGTSLGTEPLARFAYGGGGGPTDFLWLTLTTVLCPVSEFEDANRWRMLKLLGSILHHRNDAPLAPMQIQLRTLDPESLSMLEDIVFFHDPRFISQGGQVFRADTEPCEMLPNGLPRDGFLEVTVKEENVVYTEGDHPQAVTAATLAMYTAQRNHPGKFGNFEPPFTTFDKFRPGTKRAITLTVHLSDQLTCNANFDEDHPPIGDALDFDQLPKAFQDEVKSQLDLYERQIQDGS